MLISSSMFVIFGLEQLCMIPSSKNILIIYLALALYAAPQFQL